MKHPFAILLPALAAAGILGSGCIAIPMGTETFTTEYPAEIRPTTEPPVKTYEPEPTTKNDGETNFSVFIGLDGRITSEQAQEQHYEQGSIEKRKYLSFGFFPQNGSFWNQPPTNVLCQQGLPYQGDGIYSTMPLKNPPTEKPHGSLWAWNAGADSEGKFLLSILNTPFAVLFGAFMPFEHDRHYYGRFLSSEEKTFENGARYTSRTYRAEDLALLLKFSPEERERIGAWTFHEDATHPQNTFANSFSRAALFGFYKWCYYVVHDPQETERTSRADSKKTTISRTVPGPYSVLLSLPSLDYCQTADVPPGENKAEFRLLDAANGDSFANGTVRFLPPPGGLAAVRNDEDRALLELAMTKEWPVTVALPAPRLGSATTGRGAVTNRTSVEPYQISSIEPKDGTLTVRVTVTDTSKTFEIDRKVQPEVRRMFREQFATGENATRREALRMDLLDGGKALVYTVTFE